MSLGTSLHGERLNESTNESMNGYNTVEGGVEGGVNQRHYMRQYSIKIIHGNRRKGYFFFREGASFGFVKEHPTLELLACLQGMMMDVITYEMRSSLHSGSLKE